MGWIVTCPCPLGRSGGAGAEPDPEFVACGHFGMSPTGGCWGAQPEPTTLHHPVLGRARAECPHHLGQKPPINLPVSCLGVQRHRRG